jgi:hypothetical protein
MLVAVVPARMLVGALLLRLWLRTRLLALLRMQLLHLRRTRFGTWLLHLLRTRFGAWLLDLLRTRFGAWLLHLLGA